MQPLSFLVVRLMQFLREMKVLGFLYSIIVITIIAAAAWFFYMAQEPAKNVFYSGIVLTGIVLLLHFARRDHRFISLTVDKPLVVYFAEYTFLMLPFMILSWISSGKPLLLVLLLVLFAISFIRVGPASARNAFFIEKLIADNNYEWKAGTRKSGMILLAIWILSLSLVFIPYASIVILWFFLLAVSGFYDAGESREMVESYEMTATEFVNFKIKKQVMTFSVFVSPVLLLSLILFPDRWWVILLFVVFSIVNIAVFVVSKYAVWRPGEINRTNSIVNAICLLGLFLPFFLPLPVFVLIRNYRKSITNLHPLLHDYHR